MRNLISVLVLVLISTIVFAKNFKNDPGIAFLNSAKSDELGTIHTNGTIHGLDTPPAGIISDPDGSYYEVLITNVKNYKHEEFRTMKCVVLRNDGGYIKMFDKFKNVIRLSTTYYLNNETEVTSKGVLMGMSAVPVHGYRVEVSNGDSVKDGTWNLLKCTIHKK